MQNKISIGTANFGVDYGLNNNSKFNLDEISKLKKYLIQSKINQIDTSKKYKNCEEIIGKANFSNFIITTKVYINQLSNIHPFKDAENQIKNSIKKINIKKNNMNILIHNSSSLYNSYGIDFYNSLNKLRDYFPINKIGLSVYDPETYINLSKIIDIQILQFPLNIFDNRFVNKKIKNLLIKRDVTMQARSIFLQGLLLIDYKHMPIYFNNWISVFKSYEKWLNHNKITPLDACINHLKQHKHIASFIFGINSLDQLIQINESINKKYQKINFINRKIDSKLINPNLWNKS